MPNSLQTAAQWNEQKVTASDGGSLARLGSWVAISGSTAFISARNASVDGRPSEGAVYVFLKSAGTWHQHQKLIGKGSDAGDQFGTAVALHGNVALIAAPNATIDGKIWQGAVHVFVRTAAAKAWVESMVLTASDGERFGTFGTAVAFSGEYAFVASGGATSHGEYMPRKVYVFRRTSPNGEHWTQTQILQNPAPMDVTSSFGTALAASTDLLLVGARTATLGGNPGQGIVYSYRLYNGMWNQDGKISDPHGAMRDNFGVSIALQGYSALIGAQGAVVDGSEGAVYHYEFQDTGWHLVKKFTPASAVSPALFGASVSMSGDLALVGAYAEKDYRGAAYLFKIKSGQYVQQQKLAASDSTPSDVFGYYSALDDHTALVGAYIKTVGSNPQQGAAYFYDGPAISPHDGVKG